MTNRYQIANNDLAFSSGCEGSCSWDVGLCGLSSLLSGGLGDTSSRDTGFGRTLATSVGTAGAGNLIEALVELRRRHYDFDDWSVVFDGNVYFCVI